MKFDKIFKQLKWEKIFQQSLDTDKLAHAYLIVGKDQILASKYGFYLAKKIIGNCNACGKCHFCLMIEEGSHPDVSNYPTNQGDKISVSDVEQLLEKSYLKPVEGENKVFIISNLANMAEVAQNKILKILEEPPKNTYFILTAPNTASVLPTIQSRCVKIPMEEFSKEQVYNFLENEYKDKEKLELVSMSCGGVITDAINAMKSDKILLQYEKAFNIISNLTSTKEMVTVLQYFQDKDELEILKFMQMIYRDMLMIRTRTENLVYNSGKLAQLKERARYFSNATLIESIDKVGNAILRTYSFVNKTSNIDTLLLELLEVKYNCQ